MNKPTKAQNPDMDFGFYAGIPRVVRTEYKAVSPVQKWLYVCLKDLAGDDGTCYRTIRTLTEETGLSAGMISESIPVLHKAGLIHAEKKRRNTGGKEVWHITIVDIWKKNGEAHPTKRSQGEQSVPYKSDENVHTANVHHMNNNSAECSPTEHKRSPCEQECSCGETEVRTLSRPVSKNNTEARTESAYSDDGQSATSDANASTPAPSSQDELPYQPDFTASQAPAIRELSPVLDEAIEHVDEQRAALATVQDSVADENDTRSQLSTCAVEKPRQSRKKAESPVLEFTPEGRKVYDAWCSLFKSPPRTAEKTVDCANDLYGRLVPWCQELKISCKDLLKEIKGWLYTTDPDWYRRKGVTLCDIGNQFERWQSAKTEEIEQAKRPAPTTSQRVSKSGHIRTVEFVPNMAHAGDHLNPAFYDDEIAYIPRSPQGVYHA